MKKLIYADTFSLGAFHETFNASSLMMFSMIYSHITYRASKSSMQCVENLIGDFPPNVTYKPICIITGSSHWGSFLRLLSSAIWNITLVLLQKDDEVIYFNYNSLWATKVINKIVKIRKTELIITCHGEMEFHKDNIKLNALSQNCLNSFKDSRWEIADGLYFCVLGKSILRNIQKIVPKNLSEKFISYEHSFIPHKHKERKSKDGKFRIGTIGTVRENKGLKQRIFIGNALKGNPNILFYSLGSIMCNPYLLSQANIQFIPDSEKVFVPRDILNKYIDNMDCLIYIYPEDKYKLTASGALFDAIDREKIVLSLHNDYFDEIFRKANLGKQFSSINELCDFLRKADLSVFNTINFEQNKYLLSYEYASKDLKDVLEKRLLI